MSNNQDYDLIFNYIKNYYDELVEKYQYNTKSLDYGKANSQKKKFSQFKRFFPINNLSILDIGCGFGDFYRYSKENNLDIQYQGFEINQSIINLAKRIDPSVNIINYNIINDPIDQEPTHDICIANGIFYLLGTDSRNIMIEIVKKMFTRSKKAVIFNSLSSWSSFKEPNEFYADPLDTISWCREISPYIIFNHDYMKHDFTICLKR